MSARHSAVTVHPFDTELAGNYHIIYGLKHLGQEPGQNPGPQNPVVDYLLQNLLKSLLFIRKLFYDMKQGEYNKKRTAGFSAVLSKHKLKTSLGLP